MADLIAANEQLTSISIDTVAGTITYIDEDGVSTVLPVDSLVKVHETLTTITDNGDGTITYIDEDGGATILDVSNLETLTSVSIDTAAGTITYVDEDGAATVLN